MNDVIKEWMAKADGDFHTAQRELAARQGPNWDAVCFHAQQCIEKLLKALLISQGHTPPRTHDLVFLSHQLDSGTHGESWLTEDLRFLTRAAVAFRYPGDFAEQQDAAEAFEIASRLRNLLLVCFTPLG